MTINLDHVRLPDFFVAGFHKCGSTSLCKWLAVHPDIAPPSPKEPNVMAWDDLLINPFTFHEHPDLWYQTDFDANPVRTLERYNEVFSMAKPGQLRFDGTPGYAASSRARRRIKQFMPRAKLIFVLRHPTDRAVSHFWHGLRHRRVSFDMREHLRFERSDALVFSRYLEHLKPWFEAFDHDQILVLTTDELDPKRVKTIEKIASFLEVPTWSPPTKRSNVTPFPRFKRLQYALNALPRVWNAPYNTVTHKHLGSGTPRHPVERLATGMIRRLGTINLSESLRPPPIDPELRQQLDTYFTRENRGLGELIGKDLHSLWGLEV